MVWWKLISNGATVVDLARQVYSTLNKEKATSAPGSTDIHDVMNRVNNLEKNARVNLEKDGFLVDYISVVNADDLEPTGIGQQVVLAAAAIGGIRLIDNLLLN